MGIRRGSDGQVCLACCASQSFDRSGEPEPCCDWLQCLLLAFHSPSLAFLRAACDLYWRFVESRSPCSLSNLSVDLPDTATSAVSCQGAACIDFGVDQLEVEVCGGLARVFQAGTLILNLLGMSLLACWKSSLVSLVAIPMTPQCGISKDNIGPPKKLVDQLFS